jgi:regulatory protein
MYSSRPPKNNDPKAVYAKMTSFCAYQERCEQEIRLKLKNFGLSETENDAIVERLIQDNYLNESRFAEQFAGGKFRVKKWGKIKLTHELRQRGIEELIIQKALQSIDQEEYRETLKNLAERKRIEDPELKNDALFRYLWNKGYETEHIEAIL